MRKEKITDKEAFCMVFLFVTGSTLILGIGGDAKNDAWLAGIAGAIMALPVIAIYARLLSLFPGKDLFEILELTMGKIIGRVFMAFYIWYAFHLGSLVIRNFGEFINTVALPETPMLAPMLGLGLCCIFAVRSGVEVLARCSTYLLPLVLITIFIVQLLAVPSLHPEFLKPILGNGLKPILRGGFSAFSFPFAETVLLIGALYSLKTPKSAYKVYLIALPSTCALIVILTLRNIMILGGTIAFVHFPSHVAVSRITVGAFIQRIELTVAIVFVVGVFVKSSACLLVACRGVARFFKLSDYRSVAIQLGLLMVFLAEIIFEDIMTMKLWAFKIYPFYVIPFQILFPIGVWITAEIRKKTIKEQQAGEGNQGAKNPNSQDSKQQNLQTQGKQSGSSDQKSGTQAASP